MIKVDGLEPTEEFKKYIEKEKKGEVTMEDAEADYVVFRLKNLALNPLKGEYNTKHILQMHEYIFQDIFDWAGMTRTISIYKEEDVLGGQSVEYSDLQK